MAEDRTGGASTPATGRACLLVVLVGLGVLALVVGIGVGSRQVRAPAAQLLVDVADSSHHRLVVVLTVVYAAFPLAIAALVAARRRWGRPALLGLLVLVPWGLLLLTFTPGRNDDGRTAADITAAIGDLDTGEVFTTVGVASLLAALPAGLLVGALCFPASRDRLRQVFLGLLYVGLWGALAGICTQLVSDTPPLGHVLPDTAAELRKGDDGLAADFEPGLLAGEVEEVDCGEAARALVVDGAPPPDLPGCRGALLVSAQGVVRGEPRPASHLEAVVLQARWSWRHDDLLAAVADADLVDAPAGEPTLVLDQDEGLTVVVAAEDPTGVPHPEGGAGARPLTRALVYLVLDEIIGLPIAPPSPDD